MINYKYLHDVLLERHRELKHFIDNIDTNNFTDSINCTSRSSWSSESHTIDSAYDELIEIEYMLISIRNIYRKWNGIKINWKFGDSHPILNKKRIRK